MSYSIDFRKRALELRAEGRTQKQVAEIMGIGTTTLEQWEKLYRETGSLEKRPLKREPRKFKSVELRALIAEEPDLFLEEIGDRFGGSHEGARLALIREGITLKKRPQPTRNATKKNGKNSTRN